jgi:hypothetical protein
MDSQSRGLNEKSADGFTRALVLKWHKLTRDFYRIRVTYVTFVKFIYSFSPSLGPHGHRFWPKLWQSLLLTRGLHSTVNRVTTMRKSHDSIAYQ